MTDIPNPDHTRYGRQIAEYDDWEGFVVAGHDRRSWAALRRHACSVDGIHGKPYRVDRKRVDVRWVTFAERCGCTEAEHVEHLIEEDDPDDNWHGCDCEYPGLLPCSDQYSWMSTAAAEDSPGATPILEFRW